MSPKRPSKKKLREKQPPDPLADAEEIAGLYAEDDAGEGSPPAHGKEQAARLRARADEWAGGRVARAFSQDFGFPIASLNPSVLVKRILDVAIHALGAERGVLFLGRGGSVALVPALAQNVWGEELEELERISRTILGRGQAGEIVVVQDASADPSLRDVPSVKLKEIRSVLCAPLTADGEVVGVIYLDVPSRVWDIPSDAEQYLADFGKRAGAALENARIYSNALQESRRLRSRLDSQIALERLVTMSPRMDALLSRAQLATRVGTPIWIQGEPGTQKGLLARCIHAAGPRSMGPFIAHRCASGPGRLVESALFGRTARAATRGHLEVSGLLRDADRGVLYLSGVNELALEVQTKLLRALLEGSARAVGGRQDYRFDVQTIVANSADIGREIEEGRFDADLYHHLGALKLVVPPLRERPEDIPLLMQHFLRRHADDRARPVGLTFAPEAVSYLSSLPWWGNARELESLVRRALVLVEHATVDLEQAKRLVAAGDKDSPAEARPGAWGGHARPGGMRSFADQERELLRDALIRAGGNKAKAARLLGLHRNTLLRKLKKLEVTVDPQDL